jgi:hypothetical protein
VLREETLARQKELGVVPAETALITRHDEIPAWDEMSDDTLFVHTAADPHRVDGAHIVQRLAPATGRVTERRSEDMGGVV